MKDKYIFCRNVAEYAEQCASRERTSDVVPVLRGVATREFAHLGCLSHRVDDRQLDWAEWADRILSRGTAQPFGFQDSATIEVALGPAAISASYLAAATGRRLRFVNVFSDLLSQPITSRVRIICAVVDQADDRFLFGLLDQFATALDSGDSWCLMPRSTMVIARDLSSLSWMVAKLVVARAGRTERRTRLRHYIPDKEFSDVLELELTRESQSWRSSRLTASGLIESYRDSGNVMAFATHGSEACANGGDGTVLCGLQLDGATFHAIEEGVLACGRGCDCPRGPHPFPLERMTADVLMLATCNGLRLADSRYKEQFNFGFSFADGPGIGYVSSVCTSNGGDLASLAFLAAMAEGCTLGEATALINAFVHCARLERTCFVAIGDAEYRVCSQTRNIPTTTLRSLPASLALGDARFAQINIIDPACVEAAQENRLVLFITSTVQGNGVNGFHRVERSTDGKNSVLTLFLFRFPQTLGHVEIQAADRHMVRNRARAALHCANRWRETWRLVGLDAAAPDDYNELQKGLSHIETLLAGSLALLAKDGETVGQLERQINAVKELSSAASDAILEFIVPQLEGSFWLPNLHAPAHWLEGIGPARCPSCKGSAFCRTICHTLLETRRSIIVCPRCGIGSDIPFDSAIEELIIDAPNISAAGGEFSVNICVRLRRAATLSVHPRLSTHDEKTPPPLPQFGHVSAIESGMVQLGFVFQLPSNLTPHRHYVKVLAATDDGLAFGSRPFFVGLGDSLTDVNDMGPAN